MARVARFCSIHGEPKELVLQYNDPRLNGKLTYQMARLRRIYFAVECRLRQSLDKRALVPHATLFRWTTCTKIHRGTRKMD